MAFSPIAFVAPNFRDFSTYWVKPYIPGTTTPKPFALESDGGTQAAKLEINTDGFLKSAGGALVIPYIDGSYDMWMFPNEAEADANNTTNAHRIADDITGVNVVVLNATIQKYTLAEAVSNTSAIDGQIVQITDRADAQFAYLTGQTPNTFNIVVCTGVPALALVLKTSSVSINAFGASTSATPTINQGAIQAAIDSQSVVRGLTGIYKHNNEFTGKSNLIITGELGFSLECDTGFPDANQIGFPDDTDNVMIHGVIFNMRNDINTPALASEDSENSLNFAGCSNIKIFDCGFLQTLSRGIRMDGSVSVECENIYVYRNNFTNGSKGGFELRRYGRNVWAYKNVFVDSVDSSHGGDTAEKSISINGVVNGWVQDNVVVQTNGDAGTIIVEFIDRQSENITVSGNKCQGCGDNSIKVGATTGLSFYDNYSNDAKLGFYFEGIKHFRVFGNYAFDSQKNSMVFAEDGDTLRITEDGEVYDNTLVRANLGGNDIGSDVAGAWVTGTAVTTGQVVTNTGNVYTAVAAGTTGATAPTHTSGTVSDGSVSWTWLEATGSPSQASYHIFGRGGTNNIKYADNKFIEDSTTVANGLRDTGDNNTVTENDFSRLRDGVIALNNSGAGGEVIVRDNKGLKTESCGTATILQPATTVTVNPGTLLESNYCVNSTLKTKLSGTAAYVYVDAGSNNQFVLRARDAAHSAPTVSVDISLYWSWSAINANGTFAKTD